MAKGGVSVAVVPVLAAATTAAIVGSAVTTGGGGGGGPGGWGRGFGRHLAGARQGVEASAPLGGCLLVVLVVRVLVLLLVVVGRRDRQLLLLLGGGGKDLFPLGVMRTAGLLVPSLGQVYGNPVAFKKKKKEVKQEARQG